jgi:hypothetical protein
MSDFKLLAVDEIFSQVEFSMIDDFCDPELIIKLYDGLPEYARQSLYTDLRTYGLEEYNTLVTLNDELIKYPIEMILKKEEQVRNIYKMCCIKRMRELFLKSKNFLKV